MPLPLILQRLDSILTIQTVAKLLLMATRHIRTGAVQQPVLKPNRPDNPHCIFGRFELRGQKEISRSSLR
jgi:hypothetical protein